jgi:hypothetical protein
MEDEAGGRRAARSLFRSAESYVAMWERAEEFE